MIYQFDFNVISCLEDGLDFLVITTAIFHFKFILLKRLASFTLISVSFDSLNRMPIQKHLPFSVHHYLSHNKFRSYFKFHLEQGIFLQI